MDPAVVKELLAGMQAAVQEGDMEKARTIGNAAPIPLAVSIAELALEQQIASGAESTVRRGRHKGEAVAVKKTKISTSADLERFRKELALLSCINHPHVVRLLGARALPPDYMLVMPLAADNLSNLLYEKAWRPNWDALIDLACDLASAVQYIHTVGIVHRDLKPANVLMGHDGRVQLTDFGIACWAAELGGQLHSEASLKQRGMPTGGFHKKRMVGTMEYMAPELLLNESCASMASDVYALSILFAELATATFPFSDCTKERPDCHTVLEMGYGRQELAAAVAAEGLRPTLPTQAPPGFNDLLLACMARDPRSRPTMEAVQGALEACRQAVQQRNTICSTPPLTLDIMTVVPASAEGGCAQCQPGEDVIKGMLRDASASCLSDSAISDLTNMTSPMMGGSAGTGGLYSGSYFREDLVKQVQAVAGSFEAVGPRESMEDRHLIVREFCGRPDAMLMAVFDGHRGAQAAEYAAAHLPAILQQCCYTLSDPKQALVAAFQQLDAAFREVWEAENTLRQQKGRQGVLYPGCTAIAALIVGNTMYIANAGDCRAVLCQDRMAKALSRDHTVSDDEERVRVEAGGGSVRWMHGGYRIGPSGLQVSRCLGDFDVKGLGVICDPEVTEHHIGSSDLFLCLASDGLWDTVRNEDAVGLVMDTVKQPELAAKRLVMETLSRGGHDNVTAIVAFLQPVSTLEKVFGAGVAAHPATATFYGSRADATARVTPSRDEFMDTY